MSSFSSLFNMNGMMYPYMMGTTDCRGQSPNFGDMFALGLTSSLMEVGMGAVNSIFTGFLSGITSPITGNGDGDAAPEATTRRSLAEIDTDIDTALENLSHDGRTYNNDNYRSASVAASFNQAVNNATEALATARAEVTQSTTTTDTATTTTFIYNGMFFDSLDAANAERTRNITEKEAALKTAQDALAKEETRIADLKTKITELLQERQAVIDANKELLEDLNGRADRDGLFNGNSLNNLEAGNLTKRQVLALINEYIAQNNDENDNTKDKNIRDFFDEHLNDFSSEVMAKYGDAIRLIANDNGDIYGRKFNTDQP